MATACALLLDSQDLDVTVWGPFEQNIDQIIRDGCNTRYLPHIPMPPSLKFTADEDQAMAGADLIVSCIPTQFKRPVWKRFAGKTTAGVPIVSVAKGVENDTLLRPTQVITEVLDTAHPLAVLSGPSIAGELARCLPATVGVASNDAKLSEALQQTFTTRWFRVYTNDDMLGVELAGATKNVIAIAAGILDGLQAGYNAKSALLSRGLAEIARLGTAMGAKAETFFGVTGVGDLATTCFCPEGRNRSCGELLGKGIKLDQAQKQIHGIVEGVATAKSVQQLAQKHQVEMPITQAVNAVLFDGLDPLDGIGMLMSRQPKAEHVG